MLLLLFNNQWNTSHSYSRSLLHLNALAFWTYDMCKSLNDKTIDKMGAFYNGYQFVEKGKVKTYICLTLKISIYRNGSSTINLVSR